MNRRPQKLIEAMDARLQRDDSSAPRHPRYSCLPGRHGVHWIACSMVRRAAFELAREPDAPMLLLTFGGGPEPDLRMGARLDLPTAWLLGRAMTELSSAEMRACCGLDERVAADQIIRAFRRKFEPRAAPRPRPAPVAQLLRARRLELGLSIRELAARCGLGKSTIANVEMGWRRPVPRTVRMLCAALGLQASAQK